MVSWDLVAVTSVVGSSGPAGSSVDADEPVLEGEFDFPEDGPDDIPAEESRVDDSVTPVCSKCGQVFSSSHGLAIHQSRIHGVRSERATGSRSRSQTQSRTQRAAASSTGSGTDTVGSGPKFDLSDFTGAHDDEDKRKLRRRKAKQYVQVKEFIKKDVNGAISGQMEKAIRSMGLPEVVLTFKVRSILGDKRTIVEQVTFSDFEAACLARGFVEVANTDKFVEVIERAEPLAPYFFAGVAVLTLAFHVVSVLWLRQNMAKEQKALLEVVAKMQQQGSLNNNSSGPTSEVASRPSFA